MGMRWVTVRVMLANFLSTCYITVWGIVLNLQQQNTRGDSMAHRRRSAWHQERKGPTMCDSNHPFGISRWSPGLSRKTSLPACTARHRVSISFLHTAVCSDGFYVIGGKIGILNQEANRIVFMCSIDCATFVSSVEMESVHTSFMALRPSQSSV